MEELAGTAEDSIGQANAVAESLPAAAGAGLMDAAATAFTDAMRIGLGAAACALVAAFAVRRRLPVKHGTDPHRMIELAPATEPAPLAA